LGKGTRVCGGWSIDDLRRRDESFRFDSSVYLIRRSQFFMFVGFIGLNALIVFLYFEVRKKREEGSTRMN
jgi:hypothetical protein